MVETTFLLCRLGLHTCFVLGYVGKNPGFYLSGIYLVYSVIQWRKELSFFQFIKHWIYPLYFAGIKILVQTFRLFFLSMRSSYFVLL